MIVLGGHYYFLDQPPQAREAFTFPPPVSTPLTRWRAPCRRSARHPCRRRVLSLMSRARHAGSPRTSLGASLPEPKQAGFENSERATPDFQLIRRRLARRSSRCRAACSRGGNSNHPSTLPPSHSPSPTPTPAPSRGRSCGAGDAAPHAHAHAHAPLCRPVVPDGTCRPPRSRSPSPRLEGPVASYSAPIAHRPA